MLQLKLRLPQLKIQIFLNHFPLIQILEAKLQAPMEMTRMTKDMVYGKTRMSQCLLEHVLIKSRLQAVPIKCIV